jgi:putative glutamine amidotransferase
MKRLGFGSAMAFLLASMLFLGCQQQPSKKSATPLKVAISKLKADKYGHTYRQWLRRYDGTIQWINLYPLSVDSARKVLKTCDGLLCTGGGDIDPSIYGKGDEAGKCGPPDHHRDSLELALIHDAINGKMPLFGVCRGLQVINVALGGTLYTDLPTDIGTKVIHRTKEGNHAMHEVYVSKHSELYAISRADSGFVYSHHHQGIDKLGKGLRVGARSADSLPEEIEWSDTSGKDFLMAVQWHPEHLDTLAPLSKNLAVKFIGEMALYRKAHKIK